MKKNLILLIILILFFNCQVPAPPDDPDPTLKQILDKAVDGGILGISCYMETNEGISYETAGLTGIGGENVAKNNLFRICSQSKMFYGAVASILIAEGDLDEDGFISAYLPEEITKNLTNGDIITVHQLLHHSSGLFDYLNDSPDFELAVLDDLSKIWTKEEALTFAYNKQSFNNPGEAFHYSNTNYILLAMIIESVTGEDCVTVIHELLLNPLGLEDTYLDTFENYNRNLLVHGYYNSESTGLLDMRDTGGDMPGDGGIVSNPADVYKYLKYVITNEDFPSTKLRQDFLNAFLPHENAATLSEINENSYGAGIIGIGPEGEVCYTHNGGFPGYMSNIFFFPDTGKGFCIMFNLIDTYSDSDLEKLQNILAELYTSIFNLIF